MSHLNYNAKRHHLQYSMQQLQTICLSYYRMKVLK